MFDDFGIVSGKQIYPFLVKSKLLIIVLDVFSLRSLLKALVLFLRAMLDRWPDQRKFTPELMIPNVHFFVGS